MALIVQNPKLNSDVFDQRSFDSQDKFWDSVKGMRSFLSFVDERVLIFVYAVGFFSHNSAGYNAVQFSDFCEQLEQASLALRGDNKFDTNMRNINHKPVSIMEKLLMAARHFKYLSELAESDCSGLGIDSDLKELIARFGDHMVPQSWAEVMTANMARVLPAGNPLRRMCDTQRFHSIITSDMACFMAPGFFATSQQSNSLAIEFKDRRPFANVSIFTNPDGTMGLAANAMPPALIGREVITKKSNNTESFRCSQYTFYVGIEAILDETGAVDVDDTAMMLEKHVALPDVYAELLARQQQGTIPVVKPIMYVPFDMAKAVAGHIKGLDSFGSENHKHIHKMMQDVMAHETTRHAEKVYDAATQHFRDTFREPQDLGVIEKSAQMMAPRSSLFVWDLATFERVLERANNKPIKCKIEVGGMFGEVDVNAQSYSAVNSEKNKSDGIAFVAATPILSVFYAQNKHAKAPSKVVPTYLCTAMIRLNKVKNGGKGSKGKGKAVDATAEDEIVEQRGGCYYYTFVTTCLDTLPELFEPNAHAKISTSAILGRALATDVTVFHYLDTQTDKCNAYKSILKDEGDHDAAEIINKGAIINMLTSLEYVFTSIAVGKPNLANCRSIDHAMNVFLLYSKNISQTDEEPMSQLEFLNMYRTILKDNIKEPTDESNAYHYHAIVRSMEMALIPLADFINQKVLKNKPFERLSVLKPKTTPKSLSNAAAAKKKPAEADADNGSDEESDDVDGPTKKAVLPKGAKRKDAPSKNKGNVSKKSKVDEDRMLAFRVLYGIGLMRANETAAVPSRATLSALTDGKLICDLPLVQWSKSNEPSLVKLEQTKELYKKAAPDGKFKKDGTAITAWKSPLHTVALIRAQIPIVDAPIMSFRVRRDFDVRANYEGIYEQMVQLLKEAANQLMRHALRGNIKDAFDAAFIRAKSRGPKMITLGDVKWSDKHENDLIAEQVISHRKAITMTSNEIDFLGLHSAAASNVANLCPFDDEEIDLAELEQQCGLSAIETAELDVPAPKPKPAGAINRSKFKK